MMKMAEVKMKMTEEMEEVGIKMAEMKMAENDKKKWTDTKGVGRIKMMEFLRGDKDGGDENGRE